MISHNYVIVEKSSQRYGVGVLLMGIKRKRWPKKTRQGGKIEKRKVGRSKVKQGETAKEITKKVMKRNEPEGEKTEKNDEIDP